MSDFVVDFPWGEIQWSHGLIWLFIVDSILNLRFLCMLIGEPLRCTLCVAGDIFMSSEEFYPLSPVPFSWYTAPAKLSITIYGCLTSRFPNFFRTYYFPDSEVGVFIWGEGAFF